MQKDRQVKGNKMKETIFISDFDGTLSKKDFYWILLDDYIGQEGIDYYHEWKKEKKIGTEFLNKVFTWYHFSETERLEALDKVEIDGKLEEVAEYIQEGGGEFMILSAGFDYYIENALKKRKCQHLKLITNRGTFRDGNFIMEPDERGEFYSPIYGVDKEKVAKYYRKQCIKMYFAGDSEPDYLAALQADVVFAKNELASMMKANGHSFIPYESFEDILFRLKEGD